MNALTEYLHNQVPLNDEEIEFVENELEIRKYKSGQDLLTQGDVSKEFFFLIKGCVRMFYTVEGDEKSSFFYQENEFVSSYESFTKQQPSKHSFQAVEDLEVIVINQCNARDLLTKFPKFSFLAQQIMEQELSILQEVIANFITLTPEQRYRKIQKESPELLQRIPQYHLATYLGVRPETLSRIRKKMD